MKLIFTNVWRVKKKQTTKAQTTSIRHTVRSCECQLSIVSFSPDAFCNDFNSNEMCNKSQFNIRFTKQNVIIMINYGTEIWCTLYTTHIHLNYDLCIFMVYYMQEQDVSFMHYVQAYEHLIHTQDQRLRFDFNM